MMTIEEEIEALFTFLSHPAGFNVDWGSLITIRPVCESSPPNEWAVDWHETLDGVIYEWEKVFSDLHEAATFYVEKRRYLCYGLDFEQILNGGEVVSAEID